MEERRAKGTDRRVANGNRRIADRRRHSWVPEEKEDMAEATFDSSELSRLASEVARSQGFQPTQQAPKPGMARTAPYMALAASVLLALFSIYETRTASQPQPVLAASVVAPTATNQAVVLPDKLRQISNCQMESLKTYPDQGDVRALQFYNLCMTGAGFTPNYDCDTSAGVPAYNPACWTPGKNM